MAYNTYAKKAPSKLEILYGMCTRALTFRNFFFKAYDTYAKTAPSHLKILNGMCTRALTYQIFFLVA